MTWTGRWFKIGAQLHAEVYGADPRLVLCGKRYSRHAEPVSTDLESEFCEGCWKGASQ